MTHSSLNSNSYSNRVGLSARTNNRSVLDSYAVVGSMLRGLPQIAGSAVPSSTSPPAVIAVRDLCRVMAMSEQHEFDIGAALVEDFLASSLSMDDYIRLRLVSFTNKLRLTHGLVGESLKSYLHSFTEFVETPFVANTTICDRRRGFQPFDDDLRMISDYATKITRCVQDGLIAVRPTQFDVYFAAPSSPSLLHILKDKTSFLVSKSYVTSSSSSREGSAQPAMNAVRAFLTSPRAYALFHEHAHTSHSRKFVLLVIRRHRQHTRDDVLCLFAQELPSALSYATGVFEHNDLLYKVSTKQDIVAKQVNVDDVKYGTRFNLLSLSFHLATHATRSSGGGRGGLRCQLYFHGFACQVPAHNIGEHVPSAFFATTTAAVSHSQAVVGMVDDDAKQLPSSASPSSPPRGRPPQQPRPRSYRCSSHKPSASYNQVLSFPKNILSQAVHETAEFGEQELLYYYLTWTCKLQLIDGEFKRYQFDRRHSHDVALFSTELHERRPPHALLYVVAASTGANALKHQKNAFEWQMMASSATSGFWNADMIHRTYGVRASDLPAGSRARRGQFGAQLEHNAHVIRSSTIVLPKNWRKIERVCSQKRKNNMRKYEKSELDQALQRGLQRLRQSHTNGVSLIPILHINTRAPVDNVYCESLLPILIEQSGGHGGRDTRKQWAAVSFTPHNFKRDALLVNKVYVDAHDIVQKATLVDARAVDSFQWLYSNKLSSHHHHHNQSHSRQARAQTNAPAPVSQPAPAPAPVSVVDSKEYGTSPDIEAPTEPLGLYQAQHSNASTLSSMSASALAELAIACARETDVPPSCVHPQQQQPPPPQQQQPPPPQHQQVQQIDGHADPYEFAMRTIQEFEAKTATRTPSPSGSPGQTTPLQLTPGLTPVAPWLGTAPLINFSMPNRVLPELFIPPAAASTRRCKTPPLQTIPSQDEFMDAETFRQIVMGMTTCTGAMAAPTSSTSSAAPNLFPVTPIVISPIRVSFSPDPNHAPLTPLYRPRHRRMAPPQHVQRHSLTPPTLSTSYNGHYFPNTLPPTLLQNLSFLPFPNVVNNMPTRPTTYGRSAHSSRSAYPPSRPSAMSAPNSTL